MNTPFDHDFFSTFSPTTAATTPAYNEIDYYDHEISSLSDRQEKIISILPIPSAILSILGSVTIICMAYQTRRANAWSTYTRLLVAMSLNDILFSTSFSMNAFLLPAESSQRVWAFGTDTTCSITGFFLQLSSSGIFYNGMLSFYFLLTARYRVSKRTMARYIEPVMHFISLGYPFATALSGLILGVYHETELGQSCWVANYPENCGEAPGETGEPCKSTMMGYVFGAIVVGFTLLSLFFNNMTILLFVRKQMRPFKDDDSASAAPSCSWFHRAPHLPPHKNSSIIAPDEESTAAGVLPPCEKKGTSTVPSQSPTASRKLSASSDCTLDMGNDDSGFLDLAEEKARLKHNEALRKEQFERLQLVASQSYLYVAAFLLSTSWPTLIRILESLNYNKEDEDKLFPLLALQAWFFPFQGLLNLCVYARPRYLKYRKEFPKQSRLFAMRKSVYGDKVQPQEAAPRESGRQPSGSADANKGSNGNGGHTAALPTCRTRGAITVQTAQAGNSSTTVSKTMAAEQQHQKLQHLSAAEPLEIVQENSSTESSPANNSTTNTSQEAQQDAADILAFSRKLPRNMISSITASKGDFSLVEEDPVTVLFEEYETALKSGDDAEPTATTSQWWSGAGGTTRGGRKRGSLPFLSSITASLGDFSAAEDENDANHEEHFWRQGGPASTESSPAGTRTQGQLQSEAALVPPKRRGSNLLVRIPEEELAALAEDEATPPARNIYPGIQPSRTTLATGKVQEAPTPPTRYGSHPLVAGIVKKEIEGHDTVDTEAPMLPVRIGSERLIGTPDDEDEGRNIYSLPTNSSPVAVLPLASSKVQNNAPVLPVRIDSERLVRIPDEQEEQCQDDVGAKSSSSKPQTSQKDTPLQPVHRLDSLEKASQAEESIQFVSVSSPLILGDEAMHNSEGLRLDHPEFDQIDTINASGISATFVDRSSPAPMPIRKPSSRFPEE